MLGQAQAFLNERGEPLPWPQPLVFSVPVLLVTDTLETESFDPRIVVSAVGNDGRRVTLFGPARRGPARVFLDNGWIALTQDCGRYCFYSFFVDRERGLSGPIGLVLDVDVAHDRVVAVGADGLVVLDPFDPASARAVDIPVDLSRFAPLGAALHRVAFVLGEDALALTVAGPYGEESSFVVPLSEAGVLTTLPDLEAP